MDKRIIDITLSEIAAFRKKNGLPAMTEEERQAFVKRAESGGKAKYSHGRKGKRHLEKGARRR